MQSSTGVGSIRSRLKGQIAHGNLVSLGVLVEKVAYIRIIVITRIDVQGLNTWHTSGMQ